MTPLRMTSHCMTSRCSVLSLLGLCKNDCSINMLNFNKLRLIVYEIFDNSQLFLTDPRTLNMFVKCEGISTFIMRQVPIFKFFFV